VLKIFINKIFCHPECGEGTYALMHPDYALALISLLQDPSPRSG